MPLPAMVNLRFQHNGEQQNQGGISVIYGFYFSDMEFPIRRTTCQHGVQIWGIMLVGIMLTRSLTLQDVSYS